MFAKSRLLELVDKFFIVLNVLPSVSVMRKCLLHTISKPIL